MRIKESTFAQDIFNYLIKIGAKVVSYSCYVIFQMAEVDVPQTLLREILDRMGSYVFWQYLRGRDDVRYC